jgi:hypothetical protein
MKLAKFARQGFTVLFLVLLLCCGIAFVSTGEAADAKTPVPLSNSEQQKLDTFMSNFAEVSLPGFALDKPRTEDMLNFGVLHNIINRKSELIETQDSQWGVLAENVEQSVKKYFNKDVTAISTGRYTISGNTNRMYLVPRASGEALQFAQVVQFYDRQDGIYEAVVNAYSASSGFTGDTHADPAKWAQEDAENVPTLTGTWRALISKTEDGRYILRGYEQI